jgi:hypothetical protein
VACLHTAILPLSHRHTDELIEPSSSLEDVLNNHYNCLESISYNYEYSQEYCYITVFRLEAEAVIQEN